MTTHKINNIIDANKHNPNVNTDDISDGFHTFGQLYFQRMMLFATLVNLFPHLSWKTKRHEDGEECFGGGWFLVTIDTPSGAYGYHYEMKYWDLFHCVELDIAKHWDGYTEEDVNRLFSLNIDVFGNGAVESLKKDNEALKNRCFALTQGSLCFFCPVKCERRSSPFRNDKKTENDLLDNVIAELETEEKRNDKMDN